jgi:SPP1 gp7 family putative phage head morphogenesis protein
MSSTIRKVRLSPERQAWVGKQEITLKGLPLFYNVKVQRNYEKRLQRLVGEMTFQTSRELIKLFKMDHTFDAREENKTISTKAKGLLATLTERFLKIFNATAYTMADMMVEESLAVSKTALHASLERLTGGLSLNTGVVSKGLETVAQSLIAENVSLIKSIPQEYLKDVSGAVYRSITSGNGLVDLIPEIEKYDGMTERRAKNIALDQTRKAYSAINRERMKSLGIKKFEWLHSGGGAHPRPSHVAMDGNIYSFDDLPIINKDNPTESPVRGIPGQAPNCKCVMVAVFDFENEDEI